MNHEKIPADIVLPYDFSGDHEEVLINPGVLEIEFQDRKLGSKCKMFFKIVQRVSVFVTVTQEDYIDGYASVLWSCVGDNDTRYRFNGRELRLQLIRLNLDFAVFRLVKSVILLGDETTPMKSLSFTICDTKVLADSSIREGVGGWQECLDGYKIQSSR